MAHFFKKIYTIEMTKIKKKRPQIDQLKNIFSHGWRIFPFTINKCPTNYAEKNSSNSDRFC